MKGWTTIATAILVLLCMAGGAWGAAQADYTWTGATDNSWVTGGNWSGGSQHPGANTDDTATFTAAATPTLDGNSTINRLTTTTGTVTITKAASEVLTFGGTSAPTIFVLGGTLNLTCDVTLSADTTAYIAAGATLNLNQAVAGPGTLILTGPGTCNHSGDGTAPTAPTVNGTTPTTAQAPTWSWTAGSGGVGTFRYKLDNATLTSGATVTTATSFTPASNLADGSHTLYVQERDAVGNWSSSGSKAIVIDHTLPTIVSRTTKDLNGNGQIDAIDIVFSETMSGSQTGTWLVAGYTVGSPAWQSGTVLRLPLTELATPDTAALPSVRYSAGTVQDSAGNLAATEGAGTDAVDGAAPVLLSALGSGTSATLTFSEPVVTLNTGSGSLVPGDFTYTGAGGSVAGFADANGLDQAVTCTTSATITSGSDTIAAASNQIFDLTGNAMGTAAVTIVAPLATKQTVAAGDWSNGATWQGGTVPSSTDNVVIKHAVTITQNGTTYQYFQVNTITFDTGGSLAGTADVSSGSYYTIVYPTAHLIEAKVSATVTNIQFYDGYSGNSGIETIYKVASGCTFTLNNTVQGHFTGTVVKQGTGELVWNSPPNAYGGYDLGNTRVEAGILRLVKLGARPNGYAMTIFGGATVDAQQDYSPSQLTGQGVVTRSTSGTTNLGIGGGAWGGQIQDGGGGKLIAVTLTGANAWTGTNTFTGGLTLSSGTLAVSGTAAIADTCAVGVGAGAILTVNDPEAIGPITGAGDVVLNATASINQAAQAATLSGTVSGTGGLVLAGSGSASLTLSGTNTYSGGTTLQSGAALIIATGANLGAAAGALAFDGGILRLTGNVNLSASVASSTADGTAPTTSIAAAAADRPISITANDGTIDLATFSIGLPAFATATGQDLTIAAGASGDRTVFVNVAAGTSLWAGRLLTSGNPFGWFIKRGAGTLELSNATSTWSKNIVRPEQGTLRVSADGALGTVSSWVYTLAGSTFELASNYSSGVTHYVAGTMRVTTGSANWGGVTYAYPAVTPSNTPTFDVASGATLNLSGQFTYTQPWAKTGAGTLILSSGANVNASLTAAGTISGGTLQIARDDLLGAGANGITLQSGATLAVTAGFSSARAMTLGAGGGIIDVASGQTLTWSGAVGGGNALTKNGAGILVLGSAGNGQSATTVNAGTVQLASNGALGAAAASVTLAGGTLATTATFNAAATHGLTLSTASTVDVAAATTLGWPGVVGGAGPLTKTSAGTLALSGTNTFTGALAITAGTVQAGSASALGTAAGGTTVSDLAALQFASGLGALGTITEPLSLTGDGGGTGALVVLTGTSATLSGAVALAPGVNGSATISVAGSPGLTLSGAVSGNGGLKEIGGGTLTLSNAGNTFRGTILVSGSSTLQSGSDAAFGFSTNDLGFDGGTLALSAGITSARTFTVGANDATFATGAGLTLELSSDFNTASGQDLTITGTGTFRLNPAGATTSNIGGVLHGAGNLRKSGSATSVAVLAGSDDMTGTVTIDGGVVRANGTHTGAVNVNSGGVLAGTGSVGNVTVASGGTIRPAGSASAGILTMAGLTVNSGATLDYDLGTTNDLINCTGTATVQSGVNLSVSGSPANANFGDGAYTLINATTSLSYGGSMVATLPNGYSTSSGAKRAVIAAGSNALVLTTDSVLPVAAAITSTSPDGTYYVGDTVNIRVAFSKPVTLTGTIAVTLNVASGATAISAFAPTGSLVSAVDATYTVASGDLTAPAELNSTAIALTGSIVDAVGHSVTSLTLPGSTLSSNKNILIDNHVPEVDVNDSGWGVTTATAWPMSTGGSLLFNVALRASQGGDPASFISSGQQLHVLQATDSETSSAAGLQYTIRLDPSRGVVQYDATGLFAGAETTVTTAGLDHFTQADVNNGLVRYLDQGITSGNDAFLVDVTDADSRVSPLVLVRFTMTGIPAPIVSGDWLTTLVYDEQAAKPGVYGTVDAAVTVTDAGNTATSHMNGGSLSLIVQNATSGDQLDFIPGLVAISGGSISVGGQVIGTVGPTGGSTIAIAFTTDNATEGNVTALLQSLAYRNTEMAPDPSVARQIQLNLFNGQVSSSHLIAVKPVTIQLYNDAPIPTVPGTIASVPGLPQRFTVTASDPEGEPVASLSFQVTQPPTRGTLTFASSGLPVGGSVFTGQTDLIYTPFYFSSQPSTATVDDPFQITATDSGFNGGFPIIRQPNGGSSTGPAAGIGAYTARISASGGTVPRFLSPGRLSQQAGHQVSFHPEISAAANAHLTYSLVDDPGVDSFNSTTGDFTWTLPASPAPYYLFRLVVVDDVNGTTAVLPMMLRVGPGGPG